MHKPKILFSLCEVRACCYINSASQKVEVEVRGASWYSNRTPAPSSTPTHQPAFFAGRCSCYLSLLKWASIAGSGRFALTEVWRVCVWVRLRLCAVYVCVCAFLPCIFVCVFVPVSYVACALFVGYVCTSNRLLMLLCCKQATSLEVYRNAVYEIDNKETKDKKHNPPWYAMV